MWRRASLEREEYGICSSSSTRVSHSFACRNRWCTQHMQASGKSREALHHLQGKENATCSLQQGAAPNPSQVIQDIRTGLMGLNASKFSDVVLKTPDNQNVYVCRALLAVRSSFFAKLFFSDFAERNEARVPISILAKPLKQVVEFAYTGDSTLVRNIASKLPQQLPKGSNTGLSPFCSFNSACQRYPAPQTFFPAPPTFLHQAYVFPEVFHSRHSAPTTREIHRAEVTDLVELAAAADYCDVAALRKWCFKTLDSLIRNDMKTACTALVALDTRVWDEDGDMMPRKSLLELIARYPESCLLVPDNKVSPAHIRFNSGDCMGALELSEHNLKELLEIKSLGEAQEKRGRGSLRTEYLFQVIYFWGTNGLLPMKNGQMTGPKMKESCSDLSHTETPIEELTKDVDGLAVKIKIITKEQEGRRWSSAKAMVKLLDLKKMRSSFLREYVEESGLVSQEDITAAYRYHATHNEKFLLNNGYYMDSSGSIIRNDTAFGIVPK